MDSRTPHLLLYSLQGCFDGDPCLSTEMPARVWSELPMEVLERVLAKLPTTSLMRFRSVCKAWRSLLTSARFHQLAESLGHASATAAPVFSYHLVPGTSTGQARLSPHPLARLTGLAAFFSCEVRKVDLTFLPADVLALGFNRCVAQDGLFCICDCNEHDALTRIVVVNPMTRSWKALPAWPVVMRLGRITAWDIKLVKDKSSSSSFKVFLFWDVFLHWGFEIYSSSSDSWSECPSRVPPSDSRALHSQQGPYRGLQVQSGGSLYVYRSGENLLGPMATQYYPGVAHTITVFSSATGLVHRLLLNALAFSFQTRDLFLVDHEDTVYFVVGYSGGLPPAPVLRIAKLDKIGRKKWEQVALFTLADLSSKWLPRARASLEGGEEFMGLGGAVVLGDSIWISVGVSDEWHVVEFRIPDLSWHPVLRGPLRRYSDYTSTLWSMANRLVQPRVDFKI